MGMGMSMSPQIWQQLVDLVFQDDLIKCKQNFDVIMDDTFIHSTAKKHMDDLMDLFKVLRKYGLTLSIRSMSDRHGPSPYQCKIPVGPTWYILDVMYVVCIVMRV